MKAKSCLIGGFLLLLLVEVIPLFLSYNTIHQLITVFEWCLLVGAVGIALFIYGLKQSTKTPLS